MTTTSTVANGASLTPAKSSTGQQHGSPADHLVWLRRTLLERGEQAQAYHLMLTPALAKEFLERQRKNRPYRANRVLHYRNKMRADDWGFTGQPLIFNQYGQMMDGQHRCLAVIAENIEIEVLVVIGIDDAAFRYLDQGATRSGGDFLVDTTSRVAVSAALNWIWLEEHGLLGVKDSRLRMSPSDAPVMLNRHPGAADAVRRTIHHRTPMAPGLAGYSYYRSALVDSQKAEAFFGALARGEGLTSGSPILLLRERLLKNRISKAKLPTLEFLALTIKAWSKFLAGVPTGALRWRSEGRAGADGEAFPTWPGPTVSQFAVDIHSDR